jgi:hypothetical protein
VRGVHPVGQLPGERDIKRLALHVGPRKRLGVVAGLEHLLSRRQREAGVDLGQGDERLHRAQRHEPLSDLLLRQIGELEDL